MIRGQKNACYYDPFYFLRNDGEENLVQNARELANAIIPLPNNVSDPFWIRSARSVLTGAILYYFGIGDGFIGTMDEIKTTSMSELLETISKNDVAKACVNPDIAMNPKMMAGISAELHIHVEVFVTDMLIRDVLSPSEETEALRWEYLEDSDIFIRLDQSKLGQWGGVIRMMLTQLVRTLERRPEKYSPEGAYLKPTLLMFDEFPRYGKIEMIASALTTLRSKNVTIALFCQSMADLDEIYGRDTRRVIMDGCSYKAILNAADAETQEYFSKLVGTAKVPMRGISSNCDEFGQPLGYSGSITESREYIIQPHEFASLQDIVLIHPEGFCRVEKVPYYGENSKPCGLKPCR